MSLKGEDLPYKNRPDNIGLVFLAAHPRCGAKLRNKDQHCQAPAMKNGRCRLHGGKSTGAKTPEGKERSRRGNWQHGHYSQEQIEQRRQERDIIKQFKNELAELFGY